MDSSQLTRFKRDRYSANALNGANPHPIYPLDEDKVTSLKQGTKLVTHNKRIVLPGCKGPTCNIDREYTDMSGTFEWDTISTVF